MNFSAMSRVESRFRASHNKVVTITTVLCCYSFPAELSRFKICVHHIHNYTEYILARINVIGQLPTASGSPRHIDADFNVEIWLKKVSSCFNVETTLKQCLMLNG